MEPLTHPPTAAPVAIVTGGSHGAGRALAEALAGRGWPVVVVYLHDGGAAEAVIDTIVAAGGTAVAVRADLGDELDVERLLDETAAAFGGADVLVHAARQDAPVLLRQAARRLRPGGALVRVRRAEAVAPAVARELRARSITVDGTPGPHADVPAVLALLDGRRHRPGDGPGHARVRGDRSSARLAPIPTPEEDPMEDIARLAELLHETAEHHDRFEKASGPHDWWDWYAPYLNARLEGSTSEEATAAADRYMEEVHHVVVR